MKTKKFLVAAGLAAAAFAAPAMAQLSVNIGIGSAPIAPPAPVYEVAPPAPAPGYVWVPGYWGWNHDRYVWVRGRYVVGRPGYAWVPDRWDHRGDRWHHEQGHWARGGHERHEGREHGRGRG